MRQTTIFTLLIAAVMCVSLFFLKYEVTNLDQQLEGLNRNIVSDHDAIHVLKAEWAHLNEVERVRSLSQRYLDLSPTSPAHIVTLDELPSVTEPQALSEADPRPATPSAKKTVTR
jgi:hypothetical protein